MAFTDVSDTFDIKAFFISIEGEEKTGKTSLALSLASPAFTTGVIDLNNGMGGVAHKRVIKVGKGKIKVARHPMPLGDDRDKIRREAIGAWPKMRSDFHESLQKNRLTIADSGTELWLLSRQASFGDAKTESKKGSLDYDEANSRIRGMYNLYHGYNSHLVITHQMDDEFKQQKDSNTGQLKAVRTGGRRFDGFKEIPFMVQVVLRTSTYIDNTGLHFRATLQTCRFAPQLVGTEFDDDLCDLPYILGFITDTETERWHK